MQSDCDYTTSLVAQTIKCLSTMRETRVPSLGWEDRLEKEMAMMNEGTDELMKNCDIATQRNTTEPLLMLLLSLSVVNISL